jgi:hypothetical protein
MLPQATPRQRRRDRAQARGLRRKLPDNARSWIDREITQIWSETGDVEMATRDLKATLEQSAKVHGFDPATVILMLRLGVLIFEFLKALGYFKATQEQLMAILETEIEDDAETDSETTPGLEAQQG